MDSSPTFKLADSTRAIPAVGFGCWKVAKDLAPSVVEAAIKNGYRHIDCAADYGKRKYRKVASSRPVYYSIFEHFWGGY